MNEGFNPGRIDVLKTSPVEEQVRLTQEPNSFFFKDQDGHSYIEKEITEDNADRSNIPIERFVSLVSKGILHTSDIIEKDGKHYSRLNSFHTENSELAKEGELEAEILLLKYLFGDWDHSMGGWDHDALDIQDNIQERNGNFAHYDYSEAFRNLNRADMDERTNFLFRKNENPNEFKNKIVFVLDHPGLIDPSHTPYTEQEQEELNLARPVDPAIEEQLLLKTNSLMEMIGDTTVHEPKSDNTQDFFNAVISKAKLDINDERFSFLTSENENQRVEELRNILLGRLTILKGALEERGQLNKNESKESRSDFAEKLSAYLSSEQFKQQILEFGPKQRNKAIGAIIEYSILHKDQYAMEDFWAGLKNIEKKSWNDSSFEDAYNDLLIQSVAKKLGLQLPLNPEDEKKAFGFVLQNFGQNGYYFHSFNGIFEDQIKANGLSPNERLWDVNELREITAIGAKRNKELILGWHSINSEGQVFFDHHAMNTYRYAIASPEWFAQFVSESHYIDDNGKRNKEAFYRRDYTVAKENVESVCKQMKLDAEEYSKIMDFFEKYWALLAGEKSEPRLALIKTEVLNNRQKFNDLYDYDELYKIVNEAFKFDSLPESHNEVVSLLFTLLRGGNDKKTTQIISPQEIEIVRLPKYNEVYPR